MKVGELAKREASIGGFAPSGIAALSRRPFDFGLWWRTPSIGRSAFVTAVAAAFLVASFLLDRTFGAEMHHVDREPFLRAAATWMSEFGSGPLLVFACIIGIVATARNGSARWYRVLVLMIVAAGLSGSLAGIGRVATGRVRPNSAYAQGWYGPVHDGKALWTANMFHSFPSGHTAGATALFAPLLFRARRLGPRWKRWAALAIAIPLLVGLSRLLLNVHHLSDVIAGMELGLICGWRVCHMRLRVTRLPRRSSAY